MKLKSNEMNFIQNIIKLKTMNDKKTNLHLGYCFSGKISARTLFFAAVALSPFFSNAMDQQVSNRKVLAPFTFNLLESWPRDGDLYRQKVIPVCKDFLQLLNNPRANELFNTSGGLVHEGGKIKSVVWETLDKEQHRKGYAVFANFRPGNLPEKFLKQYDDHEWILQRTLVHPFEHWPNPDREERWLYRLVSSTQYKLSSNKPMGASTVPVWFPSDSYSWVGDAQGKPHANDQYGEYGGSVQWVLYEGITYMVWNYASSDDVHAEPQYFNLDISELYLTEGKTYLSQSCSFHAKNKK